MLLAHYGVPFILLLALHLELDPVIHTLTHINRFVPFMMILMKIFRRKYIVNVVIYLGRYIGSWMALLEIFRLLTHGCCIMIFGGRVMVAIVRLIRNDLVARHQNRTLERYNQVNGIFVISLIH